MAQEMLWERDAAGEAAAAAPVNSAPVLRERVNRFPSLAASLSLSPGALFLLLLPAVNCLAIADAIKTEMCLQSLRSLPSSEVPLPACEEEEGAAGRGKQRRSLRWLGCPSSVGPYGPWGWGSHGWSRDVSPGPRRWLIASLGAVGVKQTPPELLAADVWQQTWFFLCLGMWFGLRE